MVDDVVNMMKILMKFVWKSCFFSVQKCWNHTINMTFWKLKKKKEFLQKSTTFRPQKVHCLVHNDQKYKLNGTIRLENMTPNILEKRGKFRQKIHNFTTKIQFYKLEWWFGNSWKYTKSHSKWHQKFSNIFFQKHDFYEFKLPNRMTQKYLIMMKFMDFRKKVPLWFLKNDTHHFS